jgi:DNA-directed RNA polymerase specialized sigma24 family protein
MAGTPDGADLERLLAERGAELMRVAIALTGDRQSGEDLLQAALERMLRKPRAVQSDTEGYLRRILYKLAADGWRRQGRWRQRLPLLRPPPGQATVDGTADVDLRDALVRLMLQLPPRQRAVIVLRYWEQRAAYPARARWRTNLGGQSGPLPPLTCQTAVGIAPRLELAGRAVQGGLVRPLPPRRSPAGRRR